MVALDFFRETNVCFTAADNPQDADLAHLAADDFIEWSLALTNEFASLKNQHFKTDTDWWKFNIAFLEKHEYHTAYGKRGLQSKKMKNISVLQKLC